MTAATVAAALACRRGIAFKVTAADLKRGLSRLLRRVIADDPPLDRTKPEDLDLPARAPAREEADDPFGRQATEQGRAAAAVGMRLSDCPYDRNRKGEAVRWAAWRSGWREVKDAAREAAPPAPPRRRLPYKDDDE